MIHLDQTEILNQSVSAFVPGTRYRMSAIGSGSLDGLNFAVKDLIDVAGYVTGGGNPDWAADRAPATKSATVVDILLNAGASIIGKTITDELAFSLEGENVHYGTPLNPRCPDRLPGGSSSGSASAVAAGLADFALGTDTGGSVRVPAAFCGLYGFRPTHGRVSLDGVIPFAPSYDTVGWFAKSAKLLARVGDAILGVPVNTGRLRLFIAVDAFAMIDFQCAKSLLAVARELGASEQVEVFSGAADDWLTAYQILQGREIWESLGTWISRQKPRFGANIALRFSEAANISDESVAAWLPVREAARTRMRALLAPGSALIIPTTPFPPLHKTASAEERTIFYRLALTLNSIASHAGLPQITLPIAEVDSYPVGLSIIGAPGSDENLLRFAECIGPS